ncbi:CorA metal ion transporter [Coemansia sp. RSA 2705]|nr:CorA metal ion transporter [Coemansia sp. RSA 2705]
MLRAADSSPRRRHPRHHHHAAGPAPGGRIDFGALRQWAGTGEIQQAHSSGRRRRYRLGRWQSRSASSWNPPNSAPSASVAQMASQSRRSLVSIDISHKPSESRRSSVGSMQPEAAAHSIESFDDGGLGGAAGPLAEVLLRENDEIWNNGAYRFTFYSPATGTVRATDVQTLGTDSADGLDELVQQALAADNAGSGSDGEQARTDAARMPPQLSVTSVDSIPDSRQQQQQLAPDNVFLHPHYARGQDARLPSPTRPGRAPAARDFARSRDAGGGSARLFWLDVMDPGEDEIQALAQIFDLHPLTVEELLLMRDQAQDSFKSFRHYDIVCYRTSSVIAAPAAEAAASIVDERHSAGGYANSNFGDDENDEKSRSFVRDIAQRVRPACDQPGAGRPRWQQRLAALFARPAAKRDDAPDTALGDAPLEEPVADETLDEPVAFFMIVLATGVVTLHHSNVPHVRNTVARLKLDEDAVRLTPDYVAYLLLDDITDTLVPTTRLLELEVDAIDELVLILTRAEHDDVLKRIGIERRHALWLVRLLHGKAEVLRAVERRVQAKAAAGAAGAPRSSGALRRRQKPADVPADVPAIVRSDSGSDSGAGDSSDSGSDSASDDALASQWLTSDEEEGDLYALSRRPAGRASERPDVAKYLADVHDHLISLTASVHHCERILARAHGNYLARINLELTHASNTTNQLATQMTVLAGIFLPLNLVAGIFGMNVKVPGRDRDDLRDFGLIVGAMALFVVLTLGFCRWRRII